MKSIIIFVYFEPVPSFVPILSLRFSNLASSQPPCHTLSFGNFFSSFFTFDNPKFLSFQFRNPNPKLQGGVKTRLGSSRESEKNENELRWRE